jgi:hypothetical protein
MDLRRIQTTASWRCQVLSVRLRSVPIKLDTKMPRMAAVVTGQVDASRATAHAYVVFETREQAAAALAHNMQLVCPSVRLSV